MPELPNEFYMALCSASRATAQTADGWHTDLLKDLNQAPRKECLDPLFGIRAYSVVFASGFYPSRQKSI